MEYLILFSLGILTVLVLIMILKPKRDQTSILLQKEIENLREQLRKSLADESLLVDRRLETTTRAVTEVQANLAKLEESNKKIYEIGKDISSLQEILRAPKLRGGLGELFLGDLLSQVLPPEFFQLQYSFKSGEKVDAVIKMGDRLVPVDSKFPLENFRRMLQAESEDKKKIFKKQFSSDVKKHIDSIALKYILPDEKTYQFALMYIPAENIYYEIIIKDQEFQERKTISTYALEKKVIPVSPNTFYIYLKTILLGLRGMKIEEKALDIIRDLERLEVEFLKFQQDFSKIGPHLSHAKSCFDSAEKKLERFGDKLGEVEEQENQKEVGES
jgi:DNA recombination protein RmuC